MAPAADPGDACAMRSSLQRGGPDGGDRAAVHQPDVILARRARAGDPDAFGLLYLRHHHAIWRVAHGASGFARQCPDIVVESFSRVLRRGTPTVNHPGSCRPELLAEVRRLAASGPYRPADPELVIFHDREEEPAAIASPLLVEAFRCLNEPQRSAWWLLEVERLTPRETAAVMWLDSGRLAGHHAAAARDLATHFAAAVASTAAPRCRPAADRIALGAPADEVTSRHVRSCAVCQIRRQERLRPAAALCDAVPPMPLLGMRCQHHWRTA